MFTGKKALMSLFIMFLVMAFYIEPSYSQEKPSQATMKQVILNGYDRGINKYTKENPNVKVSDLKFESFKLTKGFVSKTPVAKGKSVPYNIQVDYKITYNEIQNLIKWKAEQLKQCKYNIFKAQQALKTEKAKGNKNAQLIDYNKKAIIGNKENIKIINNYPDLKKEKKDIVKNNEKMSFIKKGNKWYGYVGWK
jgi:hypothetical protein